MKSIVEYLNESCQINEMTEDQFNQWLEKNWGGYEDLYSYFSDRIDPKYTDKNKIDDYFKEIMDNVPKEILDAAEKAQLDPEDVCYQALKDNLK